ncbi:MAG: serine/threonine protein kinase [Firmicutes bacterium]|nr:serine/threonine protein kinase [Bacillota bacterium]
MERTEDLLDAPVPETEAMEPREVGSAGPHVRRGSDDHLPVRPGEVVGGRYRVLEYYRSGGQSWVYRAEDVSGVEPGKDARCLALKFYKETVEPDPKVLDVIASLKHPGLLPVLSYGWHGTRLYEVMPWAAGGSLLDLVSQRGRLEPEGLTQVVRVVNGVLEYCHAQGIIHGDIKPQNLFYLDETRTHLVVGDFGVAALLPPGQSLASLALGTLGFYGPEAYAGVVGRESDYHALGVTLIWLASGRPPWPDPKEEGKGIEEVLRQQIKRRVLAQELPVPDSLPERLQVLIRGLLVKDRKYRWGAREITRWLAGQDVQVPEPPAPVELAPTPPTGRTAFMFEGENYTATADLAAAMAEHWEEARKRLYRGHVREWVRTFDLDLANRLQDIEEKERDHDRGVHRMLTLLDPDGPYRYAGIVARTPADLGRILGEALLREDAAVERRVTQALESGTVEEWLRSLGDPEGADALRRLISRGLAGDRTALWGVHYVLCADAPLELDGSRLETPRDLATHLAADWEAGSRLSTDPRVLAWLAARGLQAEVRQWLLVAGDYAKDPGRGLAAFIPLIHPGAQDDPGIKRAYAARLQDRLEEVKTALDEHVFRGRAAEEIERQGRDLVSTPVEALDLRRMIDLEARVSAWLETCRKAEVSVFSSERPEGVLTRYVDYLHTGQAAQLAREAVSRVEDLNDTLTRVGGCVPGLEGLRAEARAASTYEEHLAVVERAIELVSKLHREYEEALARAVRFTGRRRRT